MLDLPRYLLGVAEILLLAGSATLGAAALRRWLLPDFSGAPAYLATGVLAPALLLWTAELLGSLSLFEPLPYLVAVIAAGIGIRLALGRGEAEQPTQGGQGVRVAALVGLAIAALAVVKFGLDVKPKLSTGMTGFDSTWYHAPFAAGFLQGGSTWDLHFIAPQFLAWFYPANAEVFHGVGMLAFDRDLLSPLLNLGWFVGCLLACWCIGRPYGVAPWSLSLGAVALSLPVLTDQAGEARNDIVGIFFLLAAVAIMLNASVRTFDRIPTKTANGALVVGLAAGLAAGTKLNFLLPTAALVLGLAFVAPAGARWRTLGLGAVAAVAGGGYWYLRNLVQGGGNPLPWFDSLGPISLPAPDQALGGREGHSVLGYLFDGEVWSDWLLPGLRDGLSILWPAIAGLALAGILLALAAVRSGRAGSGAAAGDSSPSSPGPRSDVLLAVAGATALAAALAWLIAPTSASGPEGIPRGFESGLRYLAPALVLGLALLPAVLAVRFQWSDMGSPSNGWILKVPVSLDRHLSGRGGPHIGPLLASTVVVLVIAIGYPVQRHYLENRYESPSFAAPGLNAAFKWATPLSGTRIATTSTRQYPLYGTDLSNQVQFVGEEQPNGGFTAPTACRRWREVLNKGDYDYVVTTRDRIEPNNPPYPASTRWTEGKGASIFLRQPPTVVFKLNGPLSPSACP